MKSKSSETKTARAPSKAAQPTLSAASNSLEGESLDIEQDATGVFAALSQGAGAGDVPFRDELEDFYGEDLSGLKSKKGVSGLEEIGANAAAFGDTALFGENTPNREVVGEEVGHYLQAGGKASGTGLTDPNGAVESEAAGAGAAFGSGGGAPKLSGTPSGVARDPLPDSGDASVEGGMCEMPAEEEEESGIDKLRAALDGGGMFAGFILVAIVATLNSAERQELEADADLLGRLGSALSGASFLRVLDGFGWPLRRKFTALHKAGTLTSLDPLALSALVMGAEAVDQYLMITDKDYGVALVGALPDTPFEIVANLFGSPLLGAAFQKSPTFTAWVIGADMQRGIEAIGGPNVTDGNLAAILPALGPAWTVAALFLPSGEAQSAELKAALRRFAELGSLEMAKRCFTLRFSVDITGRLEAADGSEADSDEIAAGTATAVDWTNATIVAVWDQLAVLPVSDVSENAVLDTFQAISGSGGFWSGNDTIKLGQGASAAKMDHTVRHEIGHAVHTKRKGAVDAWLTGDIGFVPMETGLTGIGELVTALGGFPSVYEDAAGVEQTFGMMEQVLVLAMLGAHAGSSSWSGNTPLPVDPPVDPIDFLWKAMPAAVQTCFQMSSPRWYNNWGSHAQGPNGSYFFNHWYNRPYWFSARAKGEIGATGENYTAMSEKEFFANCYAEYFEDPAGFTDHSKWGGSLSGGVKTFFSDHIVDHQPYTVAEKVAEAIFGVEPPAETTQESNT